MTETRTATLRAAIYCRESSDRAGDAHNVADQLAENTAHCAMRDYTVTYRLTDNDLPAHVRRPGYEALMALVDARQIDVIVVREASRLYRHMTQLESIITRCQRAGVRIDVLAGVLDLATSAGKMAGRMLAAVHQHEIEQKAERQAVASKQAAARGQARKATPRPFGWEDDRVTRRPAEAAAAEWAAGYMIKSGNLSGVSREWVRRGLRPPQAPFGPVPLNGWKRASIVTILTNPRIAGIASYLSEADRRALREAGKPRPLHAPVITGDDGQPVRGEWEPIIDVDTWEAVCGVLADPARKPSRKGRSGVRSLLGGLALCRCGNVVAANHVTRLDYSQYRCQPATRTAPGPHACQRMDAVDACVSAVIIERLSRPDAAGLITPARPDLRPLRIEQANKRAKLTQLGEDFDNDVIGRDEWLTRRGKLTDRLAGIDAALADAGRDSVLSPFAGGQAAQVWAGLDDAQRRAVIDALCVVTVHPAGRGARTFNPETVKIGWHQP
jgi:DNA invertase Pin-like site-specific DNA recombinase